MPRPGLSGVVRRASYPPAVRWLRPSSEDEMVALSLRTELALVRHGSRIRELLDREKLSECLLTAADLTSPRENAVRRHLAMPQHLCVRGRALCPAGQHGLNRVVRRYPPIAPG